MTPEQFSALVDRACRGTALTPEEGAALRAGIAQLQQQAQQADITRWSLREELAQTEEMYLSASRRADRYRAAWQSARVRARLIPFGGNQVYDGTRWRPALQAYSTLRARLAAAEASSDRVSIVLHRWMGCASNEAALLRTEIREAQQ